MIDEVQRRTDGVCACRGWVAECETVLRDADGHEIRHSREAGVNAKAQGIG
jgi:hypothetical protein